MDDIKKITPKRTSGAFMLPDYPHTTPPVSTLPLPEKTTLRRKPLFFRFLFSGIALVMLVLALITFFLVKGVTLGQNIQFENTAHPSFLAQVKNLTHSFFKTEHSLLQGEAGGRINILLLGRAGEHYPGKNLTDTVIIMSIDTAAKKVALLSLPRDLFVPIVESDYSTKLNSLYQYGLSRNEGVVPLKQTIEHITGMPLHYFITLDFDGFEKIVDTLGGISLEVTRDLYDSRYPGKNYSYETFEIKKGWQTLDGATALKYVRERHSDPEGDFGRAKRQQQVIQALKNKAFSLGTLTNIIAINRLIDTLGESIKTDIAVEDMTRFLELIRTLDTQNVTATVIDAWKKESLLRVSHIDVGGVTAFILVPRVGNWSELKEVATTIFRRDEQEKRKKAIVAEQSTLRLYYSAPDRDAAEKMAILIRDELGFFTVSTLLSPPFPIRPKESIMVKQVGLQKPFSLDELLRRFSFKDAVSLPFSASKSPETDFTIIMGSDLAETFSLPLGNEVQAREDDTTFSEPLPPIKQLR